MRIIYPNKITSVVADTENADFPKENILDHYLMNPWKATANTATLTLSVGASSGDVAIFKTNAATVKVEIWNDAEDTKYWESGEYIVYQSRLDTYRLLIIGTDETDYPTSLWVEYGEHLVGTAIESMAHKIKLIFSTTAPVVETGIIRAGLAKTFLDPQYSLQESLVDYSIYKELNNGSEYYRPRNIVRKFSGSVMTKRDREFYSFVTDIARKLGRYPFAVKISENLPNQDWTIFGRFDGLPSGSHSFFTHSDVNFNIIEAV